jgi:hypothetical protein
MTLNCSGRFLISLLCGLEDARHIAVWRVQELGKKRKKLAALLTRSRLEKWTEQALSPVKGLDVFFLSPGKRGLDVQICPA